MVILVQSQLSKESQGPEASARQSPTQAWLLFLPPAPPIRSPWPVARQYYCRIRKARPSQTPACASVGRFALKTKKHSIHATDARNAWGTDHAAGSLGQLRLASGLAFLRAPECSRARVGSCVSRPSHAHHVAPPAGLLLAVQPRRQQRFGAAARAVGSDCERQQAGGPAIDRARRSLAAAAPCPPRRRSQPAVRYAPRRAGLLPSGGGSRPQQPG